MAGGAELHIELLTEDCTEELEEHGVDCTWPLHQYSYPELTELLEREDETELPRRDEEAEEQGVGCGRPLHQYS